MKILRYLPACARTSTLCWLVDWRAGWLTLLAGCRRRRCCSLSLSLSCRGVRAAVKMAHWLFLRIQFTQTHTFFFAFALPRRRGTLNERIKKKKNQKIPSLSMPDPTKGWIFFFRTTTTQRQNSVQHTCPLFIYYCSWCAARAKRVDMKSLIHKKKNTALLRPEGKCTHTHYQKYFVLCAIAKWWWWTIWYDWQQRQVNLVVPQILIYFLLVQYICCFYVVCVCVF